MGGAINPQVLAVEDALRKSGIRTFLTQRYQRGGPKFLVGKAGRNAPLLWVNQGEANPTRPQVSSEEERWIQWLNYGQDPLVPTAVQAQTPQDAVDKSNHVYIAGSEWPPNLPIYNPGPSGSADAFATAFKHSLLGDWSNFNAVDASRFIISDAPIGINSSLWPQSAWVNCLIKNGDATNRAEVFNSNDTAGKVFKQNDTADINFEVSFQSDFPATTTARQTIMRLSAFTNGLPPLEFLLKKNGAGVDTIFLRLLGSEHDLAGQSTLDTVGGYVWSTPLVRASGYTAMNWLKLTLRCYFQPDSTGWVELYRDYNFNTPVLARTNTKLLTDTSGTVRSYARFGLDRHSSITGDTRGIISACRYRITRP
jgi:hypothetical protein